MIEAIVGGALMLVGGLFQHLYQRMRNKDERKARWEDVIREKQLEAFDEAVRMLYFMNSKWVEVVELNKKMWLLRKTKVEEGDEQREGAEALRVLEAEYRGVFNDFERFIIESQDTRAKIGAYLPMEAIEAYQRYGSKAKENLKWMESLAGEEGEEKDFKLAKELLSSENASAVFSLREHMGIKERIQPRKRGLLGTIEQTEKIRSSLIIFKCDCPARRLLNVANVVENPYIYIGNPPIEPV